MWEEEWVIEWESWENWKSSFETSFKGLIHSFKTSADEFLAWFIDTDREQHREYEEAKEIIMWNNKILETKIYNAWVIMKFSFKKKRNGKENGFHFTRKNLNLYKK